MTDLVDRLKAFNSDREPERLAMKYRAMRAGPFAFFRGTDHLFYADLPKGSALDASPPAWISGDLHLENFGVYKGDNRLTYFDLNDFDEACLAPASWELTRLVTSLYHAAEEIDVAEQTVGLLADTLLGAYCAALRDGKARWVERATATGMVRRLLRAVKDRTRRALLDRATTGRRNGRALTLDGTHRLGVRRADRLAVASAIRAFAASERRPAHYPRAFFRVLDVARRVAGTGSLGLQRYIVLVEGRGGPDGNFLLDVKEARVSCLAPYVPLPQPIWPSEAARVVSVQHRAEAIAPSLLDYFTIQGRPYVLKELQPVTDRLVIDKRTTERSLAGALTTMASVTAWSHLRSGGRDGSATADQWVAFAHDPRWMRAVLSHARRARANTLRDFAEYARAYDAGAFK
ncbi:MAG TPA: DUF2252 family protein [Gemmatimonadaceae bacterium]|jgi:uncharacterized protein (DUF2252 family)|nr:DUF2252 family protein [Gemmatimonadaceae bacterium]